jgi:hypothetical protein
MKLVNVWVSGACFMGAMYQIPQGDWLWFGVLMVAALANATVPMWLRA